MGLTSGVVVTAWNPAQAREKLISHLLPPHAGTLPDQSILYHTACSECPAACGMQVAVRAGHPIKLEGAPDDPFSGGGLCLRGQASLARLYHPERVRQPMARASDGSFQPTTWDAALRRIKDELGSAANADRDNIYLSGQTTGALADLIDNFGREQRVTILPEIELYNYAAIRTVNDTLFGRRAVPAYRIDQADHLITLGADLLDSFLNPVAFTHAVAGARERGLKWTHLEPGLTLTGIRAAERRTIKPGSEAALLAHLLAEPNLTRPLPATIQNALPRITRGEAAARTGLTVDQISALTTALTGPGRPLVLAGGIATAQTDEARNELAGA